MGRRRRAPLDWVQNFRCYASGGGGIGVTAGNNLVAAPLVYSKQIQLVSITDPVAPLDIQAAAFPNNAARQVVRAVRGQLFFQASEGWANGNARFVAFRIAKFKMDPDNEDILLPVEYTLWEEVPIGNLQGPYVFADSRFLWERRVWMQYNPNNVLGMHSVNVNWSGFEVLEHDECLALLIQNTQSAYGGSGGPAGGEIILQSWLRTLCQVPS